MTSGDTGACAHPMPTPRPTRAHLGLLVGVLHAAHAAVSAPELGQLPLRGTEPLLEGVHGLLEALGCGQDALQAAVPEPAGLGEPGGDRGASQDTPAPHLVPSPKGHSKAGVPTEGLEPTQPQTRCSCAAPRTPRSLHWGGPSGGGDIRVSQMGRAGWGCPSGDEGAAPDPPGLSLVHQLVPPLAEAALGRRVLCRQPVLQDELHPRPPFLQQALQELRGRVRHAELGTPVPPSQLAQLEPRPPNPRAGLAWAAHALLTFCSSSCAFTTLASADGGFWFLTSSSMSATQASSRSSVSWPRSAASSGTGTAREDTCGERRLSHGHAVGAAVGLGSGPHTLR